jgi:hypothetical protein
MKFPIVLSEHGDITVFADKESAENYLEPQDLTNAEYEIFDANGNRLCSKIKEIPARHILGKLLRVKLKAVELSDFPGVQNESERLRDLLLQYMTRVKPSFEDNAAPIVELIDAVLTWRH